MNASSVNERPRLWRWMAVTVPALVFILVPFFLFGARMDEWATTLIQHPGTTTVVFFLVVFLLASDVVLPIPSSVVSTMAGAMMGGAAGTVASWLGMTVGSAAGYALGAIAGRRIVNRLAGPISVDSLERDMSRYGVGLVAVCRAIPCLAEATTIIAGASRMPFTTFIAVAATANLGVSIVYAAVGAMSAQIGSFLLAVAGSMVLPGIFWWLWGKRGASMAT